MLVKKKVRMEGYVGQFVLFFFSKKTQSFGFSPLFYSQNQNEKEVKLVKDFQNLHFLVRWKQVEHNFDSGVDS